MKRYLRLFARTFGISTSVMLMYRLNIVFFLIFETVFLGAQLLTVNVGFNLAGGEVAGWTRDQAFLLTTISGLSHQIFICFFINPIFNLGMQVWNGQYDYILLKPLHPLLSMLFNGQFVVSNMPNLLVNFCAVAYFLSSGRIQVQWVMLPVFGAFVVIGLGVRVALALACVAPAFYSERLADVEDSFWSFASLSRYPLAVYPRTLELVFTFVFPIGMMASLPASVLFRPEHPWYLLGAALAAVGFVMLAVWFFMVSVRRYQSVNSGV